MTNQEFLREISQEGEEWRDVVGYEGRYMVSSFGRIFGYKRRKSLILQRKNEYYRYLTVVLFGDDEKYHSHYVHRLVAEAFIPNLENKAYIDHIDTDVINNHVSNLRWVTQSENHLNPITRNKKIGSKHNLISPLRKKVVQLKDGELIATYDYIAQVKEKGFSNWHVSSCCSGRLRQHKGFQWMFLSDYEASNQ